MTTAYLSIYEAARFGDELEVRRLVKAGADAHARCPSVGVFAIHRASEVGSVPIVRFLVEECHVDVNVRDNSGTTPLHYAAYNGHLEVLKYLIEVAKAKPDVENNDKVWEMTGKPYNYEVVMCTFVACS